MGNYISCSASKHRGGKIVECIDYIKVKTRILPCVVIQPAERGYIDPFLVKDILTETFIDTPKSDIYKYLYDGVNDRKLHFFIIYNSQKVGVFSLIPYNVKHLILGGFAILPEFQGKRIGTAVMEQICIKYNNLVATWEPQLDNFYGRFNITQVDPEPAPPVDLLIYPSVGNSLHSSLPSDLANIIIGYAEEWTNMPWTQCKFNYTDYEVSSAGRVRLVGTTKIIPKETVTELFRSPVIYADMPIITDHTDFIHGAGERFYHRISIHLY